MTRHWAPIVVFSLFAAINMLDRQLLAALAPAIRAEFGLTNAQFGLLGSVFFAATFFASPLAGLFLDRVGLTLGAPIALTVWSIAGAATGVTNTLRGLIASRFGLAVGESVAGATPGVVAASYLDAGQLGIGAAVLASGTSLGAIAAPLIAAALATRYGWRAAFIVCAALGLLWIPVWLTTAKLVPPRFHESRARAAPIPGLLTDRRFWNLIVAYALARQTLWVAWTTLYFVDARHLSMLDANRRFSWFPSVFGAAGAFVAGAIARRWIRGGMTGVQARLRTCWFFAPLVVMTAIVPWIPSNTMAAVAVGVSFFGSVCIWTSTHLMPLDLYGVGRSGFTYAVLEGGFTGLQVVAAPLIGAMLDRYGYTLVCLVMPVLPLLGLVMLTWSLRSRGAARAAA